MAAFFARQPPSPRAPTTDRQNESVNLVLQTLETAGVTYRVHSHPPIRVEADLRLTGLDLAGSVKTLAFALPDGTVALVAVPGPARVRYGAVAKALGVPRSALRPAAEETLALLGMERGGVSPICAEDAVVLLLDLSVPDMGRIYCGGGDAETTIELDAAALLRIARHPLIADVTTG